MKFYIPCELFQKLEQQFEIECLLPADFDSIRGTITLFEYSNGWMIKADDSLRTYIHILTGISLPGFTDSEYRQFVRDKQITIEAYKTNQLWNAWHSFKSLSWSAELISGLAIYRRTNFGNSVRQTFYQPNTTGCKDLFQNQTRKGWSGSTRQIQPSNLLSNLLATGILYKFHIGIIVPLHGARLRELVIVRN